MKTKRDYKDFEEYCDWVFSEPITQLKHNFYFGKINDDYVIQLGNELGPIIPKNSFFINIETLEIQGNCKMSSEQLQPYLDWITKYQELLKEFYQVLNFGNNYETILEKFK